MAADEAAASASEGPPAKVTLGTAMALLGFQAVAMVAVGGLLWEWSGRPRSAFVTFSMEEVALGFALALGLIASAWTTFRMFPRYAESLVRMQGKTYAFLGPKLGWPAIVFISLCAGVGEEALFRGGLQTFLMDHVGPIAAITLSSALFALVHLGKPVITALLFGIGVVFGVVFWLTGSLLVAMVGHALYDVWALRYLHREFLRLGLVATSEPPLANPVREG